VDLEIAVVAVSLARQQALELELGDALAQRLERLQPVGDDRLVGLFLGELDQLDGVLELTLDRAVAGQAALEPGLLLEEPLGFGGSVPQAGIVGGLGQLDQPLLGRLPVKDASAARPAIAGWRLRSPRLRRASEIPVE
jgi:hypothetical protein